MIKEFPDTVIQHYLDYYALYSKPMWLLLLDEKLRRIELEIAIV